MESMLGTWLLRAALAAIVLLSFPLYHPPPSQIPSWCVPPKGPTSSISIPPPLNDSKRYLASAMPTQRRSSRADPTSGRMSWCRRRLSLKRPTTRSRIRSSQSRNDHGIVAAWDGEGYTDEHGFHDVSPIAQVTLTSERKNECAYGTAPCGKRRSIPPDGMRFTYSLLGVTVSTIRR